MNAFRAGDKYYDQKVFVEGSKNVHTGRGEDKFYKHPTVVVPNAKHSDKGLDVDILKMKMPALDSSSDSKLTMLDSSSSSNAALDDSSSSSTSLPDSSSSSLRGTF